MPPSSSCQTFPLPLLRGQPGVLTVPVAGSASDRSVILSPFVWVTISGLGGEHRVVNPTGDGRTAVLTHAFGVHRVVVDVPGLKPLTKHKDPHGAAFDERMDEVVDLVAEVPVSRLVIDLRCHATELGYLFGNHLTFKASELIERILQPLIVAHLEQVPNAAALSPPPLARTVLVVLHCCDVSGVTGAIRVQATRGAGVCECEITLSDQD